MAFVAVIQRAKVAFLAAARFSAHLAHVGFGALRVNVQHAVVVFARTRGVAVLQEQRGTLEQARHTRRIGFRRVGEKRVEPLSVADEARPQAAADSVLSGYGSVRPAGRTVDASSATDSGSTRFSPTRR